MRIAIIGTGIAGMSAAYLLNREHEITVFEQRDRMGGHAHTVTVAGDEPVGVDTGFVVFNPERYPNLVRLFDRLDVATQETDMSFSVRCRCCNLEYSPQSLSTLFAQWRNLIRPAHYQLIRDALRAVRDARRYLAGPSDTTLGEFIESRGYSRAFADHLLVPLAAAIWSTSPGEALAMPARFCLQFFNNHRMLAARGKPTWRTVCGGSQSYVKKLTAAFRSRVLLECGIARVRRETGHVALRDVHGRDYSFDGVVIAAHADQALRMLADPSDSERELLGAFSYSRNDTVLHTDPAVLPRRHAVRSSWNYELEDCRSYGRDANDRAASADTARESRDAPAHVRPDLAPCVPSAVRDRHVSLSYYMNRLQRIESPRGYCVTLNRQRPVSVSQTLWRDVYEHPIFSQRALEAQKHLPSLNGVRRTWFCGAHFGYGFHEDGLASGMAVANSFGITL